MFSFLRKLWPPPPEKVIAYLDESIDETVFVLAGFAAPPDEWEKFSVAWRNTMAASPAISILKTNDAMKLQGEFSRWTSADHDAKLSALYAVIDDHVSFALSAVVPLALLKTFNDPRFNKGGTQSIHTCCIPNHW